jgi:hypothetical protein
LLPAQNTLLPTVTNTQSKQNGEQNGEQNREQAHETVTGSEHTLDDAETSDVTEWETLVTTHTPFKTVQVEGKNNNTWSVTYNSDKVELPQKRETLEELFEKMQTVREAETVILKAKDGLKVARSFKRSKGEETPSTRRYMKIIADCNKFIEAKEAADRERLIAEKLNPSVGKGANP